MQSATPPGRDKTPNGYQVEYWLSTSDAKAIAYAEYWNDETVEAKKEWNILDKGFSEMESNLASEGFAEDIRLCVRTLEQRSVTLLGRGIDLAAGCLWAVPVVLESTKISHLHCLEFSQHRLLKLGPRILEHYETPQNLVTLVYGSFYDLRLENESLDFALLASAFHHADDPNQLLKELNRVLKPGSPVIVTGEPKVDWLGQHLKYLGKLILPRLFPKDLLIRLLGRSPAIAAWPPNRTNVFPVDPLLGDHLYTLSEYRRMFNRNGFRCEEVSSKRMRSFLLFKV